MKSKPWIITHRSTNGDDAMAMECLRCGAKQRSRLPVAISVWCAAAQQFEREHAACLLMVPINLQSEFETYMRACYGDRTLPPQQIREVEQAFLSGIHVLNEIVDRAGSRYGTMWLRDALRVRLTELGSFPG